MTVTIQQQDTTLPPFPDSLVFPIDPEKFTLLDTKRWFLQSLKGETPFTSIVSSNQMSNYLQAKKIYREAASKNIAVAAAADYIGFGSVVSAMMFYPYLLLVHIPPEKMPSPIILLYLIAVAIAAFIYGGIVSRNSKTEDSAEFFKTIRKGQEQAFRKWLKSRYGIVVSKEQSRHCCVYGILQEKESLLGQEEYLFTDVQGNNHTLKQDHNNAWYVTVADIEAPVVS